MHRYFQPRGSPRGAFTLLELLVSMVLLLILATVVFSITHATAMVWKGATTKIDAFQGARTAFEAMTRNLSQATLNTYWDYFDASGNQVTNGIIDHYGRFSELHFICGRAGYPVPATSSTAGIISVNKNWSLVANAVRPTHAVFFTAPLGSGTGANLQGMDKLLNAVGYYVEFNDDHLNRPAFLQNTGGIRYRYRLMEMIQPTENLAVYNPTQPQNGTFAQRTNWVNASALNTNARPIADNIIALIIQPKRSIAETGILAPNYYYDSRTTDTTLKVQRYQLPPIVQVTMVALDETSAQRLAQKYLTSAPKFGSATDLFANTFVNAPLPSKPNTDLDALLGWLNANHYTYHVFSTNVMIRGAKWSED